MLAADLYQGHRGFAFRWAQIFARALLLRLLRTTLRTIFRNNPPLVDVPRGSMLLDAVGIDKEEKNAK
ncbi:hypothetical protein IMZ48_13695 [Candidatus Bathyarchaeota archaeon]|nr:hypothetical protein [Candidatus Bathyarchaeota archaeon]